MEPSKESINKLRDILHSTTFTGDSKTVDIVWGPAPANVLDPIPLAVEEVDKQWGRELWVANNRDEDYCAKLLYINAGHQFSYHFHHNKHETFYLLEGECQLHWIDTEVGEERMIPLEQGVPMEIPRLMPHSAEAITDCVILEVSTFHQDDDSFRVYRK